MRPCVPAPAELADAIRKDLRDVVDRMLEEGGDPLGVIRNEHRNPDGMTVLWSAIADGKLRYVPKLLGKGRMDVPPAIVGALGQGWPGDVDETARRDIDAFEMLGRLPRNLFRPALDTLLGVMAPESPGLAASLWRLAEVLTVPGQWHPRANDGNNFSDAVYVISVGGTPTHLPENERAAAWQALFSASRKSKDVPSGRWGASFLSSCLFAHSNKTAQMLKKAFSDGMSPEATIDGFPLLILAVGRSNPVSVEVILESGADIRRVHEMQMGYGLERGDAIYYASLSSSNACLEMLEAYAAHTAVRAAIARAALPRRSQA